MATLDPTSMEPCKGCGKLVSATAIFGYCTFECFRAAQRAEWPATPKDPRCKVCREPIGIIGSQLAADGFCSNLCMSTWKLREDRKRRQTAGSVLDSFRPRPSYADELAGDITLSIQQFSFSTLLRMRTPAGFSKAPICQMKEHDLIAAGLWDLLPK